MSEVADRLDIQDVHPVEPAAEPIEKETVTPAPEPEPIKEVPTTAPTEKVQQPVPDNYIPRYRLNEEVEKRRAVELQLAQFQRQAPAAPVDNDPRPKMEAYDDYQKFTADEAAWHGRTAARQEFAKLKQSENAQAQQNQVNQRAESALQSWSKKMADTATKDPVRVQRAIETLGGMPLELGLSVLESDAAKELTDYFVDNPNEAYRLSRLSPVNAGIEIGRMSAKLTAVTGGPQKKPSAQAPNLDPVGGGRNPGKSNVYAPQSSEGDYIAGTRRLPR